METARAFSAATFLIDKRDNHPAPLAISADCHWQLSASGFDTVTGTVPRSAEDRQSESASGIAGNVVRNEEQQLTSIVNRTETLPPLGIAQLTLVEHSLCPLATSVSLRPNLTHTSRFRYRDTDGRRKRGTAVTRMPLGFSATDEFHLWGMLALSLQQPKPEIHFAATPHFILRELGCIDAETRRGGKNYRLFRESIDRLAVASYTNDSFYDPVRKVHDRYAFGFLSYRAPQDLTSGRLWHFYWDPLFFEFCMAIGGRLRFDLQVYRKLDAAGRRLFLLLHKIFHRRRTSPVFPVRELMTNVLGYSDGLTNGERNQKLRQVARRLDQAGVIKFDADDVERTGSGNFTVQFRRGQYFDDLRDARNQPAAGNSPLADALRSLGFESRDADRVCSRYEPSLLREWIDITIAFEERNGPNAFKRSRQAFLIDNLKHAAAGTRSAPDWWQEIRRREQRTDGTSRDRNLLKQLQAKLGESTDDSRTKAANPTSGTQRIGDILHSI